jgi:hypothetical protein
VVHCHHVAFFDDTGLLWQVLFGKCLRKSPILSANVLSCPSPRLPRDEFDIDGVERRCGDGCGGYAYRLIGRITQLLAHQLILPVGVLVLVIAH